MTHVDPGARGEQGGYLGEFGHHDGDEFVCLRCGAIVPANAPRGMNDYDDPREKHYEWHRRPR